jgi:hypothetical protein
MSLRARIKEEAVKSIGYVWEVFYLVARGLATSRERLQTRLEYAFSYTVSRLL